jgi:GNAT superfamily N-acetyltransferase
LTAQHHLLEVTTPEHAREFREFPVRLYRSDPNYIRPLDKDIEQVFDTKKNKYFRAGELTRWLLQDSQGQTIGRVAAFINKRTAKTFDQPTGGMGFFECIDDQAAANTLLDACRTWLAERGMEAMDGPINFGDRDQWWGLLIDNFGAPLYGQNYNPPYYRRLLETYGFQVYFNQFTYFRKVADPLEPEYQEKAQRMFQNPKYTFEHMRLKNLEKYAEDFRIVYNQAWVKHDGVKAMRPEQSRSIMKKLRPVIDEKGCWFAYYEGEPVGFFIALPELNELFKHVNGNLNWLGKLKFAYYRWRGSVRTLTGIAFGIAPAHQRRGVEAAMVLAVSKVVQDRSKVQYEDFVMNWIGDFNPRMMAVAEQIGGKIWRTHATFRYLFDREKEFKRAPIIK